MKRTVQFALLAVAVLLAVGITLYPLIANAYTERNRSLIETEYTEAISQMDNTALENAIQAARVYNASLRGVTGMTFSKEAVEYASASYEQLLNVHQDGIMAYVEIPKISVNLPIYHFPEPRCRASARLSSPGRRRGHPLHPHRTFRSCKGQAFLGFG